MSDQKEKYIKSIINWISFIIPLSIFVFFFINKYWVNNVIWDISWMIDNLWNTSDVNQITWDLVLTWEVNTWIIIEISKDIDITYKIIENWKPWYDYSAISFKPQIKKWSEWWYIDSAILKDEYLPNNRYSLIMPSDIKWWYLYIKTRQQLKFMSNIWVYQPITIWTNIYDTRNMRIYGRLDTKKSLPVYQWNQEFLYKLDNISIAKSTTNSWLGMKWKTLQIWWFVWDVSGNWIDKIIFIRQR